MLGLFVLLGVTESLFGEDPAPKLEVKIAIPVHHHQRSLNTNGDHFHVLVKNISDQPLRLWSEHFSWGYENLTFEEITEDGKVRTIQKNPGEWSKNFPDWLELKPDDTYVLNVKFAAPGVWENPPQAKAGEKPTKIKLRAVYQISPDKESNRLGVWTGKVVSAVDTYAIW